MWSSSTKCSASSGITEHRAEDSNDSDGSSEDAGPPSLRAFKQALLLRDAAMSEMHTGMLADAASLVTPTPTTTAMASSAPASGPLMGPGAEGSDPSTHSGGPNTTSGGVIPNGSAAEEASAPAHAGVPVTQGQHTLRSPTAEDLAAAIAAATASMALVNTKPGTITGRGPPATHWEGPSVKPGVQGRRTASSPGQQPAAAGAVMLGSRRPGGSPGLGLGDSDAPLAVAGSDGVCGSSGEGGVAGEVEGPQGVLVALEVERRAIRDRYQAQEAAHAAEKEQRRVTDGEAAAARLQGAEAQAAQQAADMERRAAELERRSVRKALAAQQKHDLGAARLHAEAAQMEEGRRQGQERLAQMESQALARTVLRQQAAAEISAQRVLHARLHLAASRICRAWRRYCTSPVHAAKLRGVVLLQSLWRGLAARRRVAALRAQRRVLLRLEEAASSGLLELAREAAQQAETLGVGSEAQRRLLSLESAAAAASKAVTAAASGGSVMSMTAALLLASKFPHLALLVGRAEGVFVQRRSGAEEQMARAISELPMSDVVSAMDAAAQMGLPAAALVEGLGVARRRDADAGVAMKQAAQQEPYDASLFRVCVERALQLGLKADVAACRHMVERRKRQMGVRMLAVGTGASAKTVRALAAAGRLLGLDSQALELESALQQRQVEALQHLQHCIASAVRLTAYNQAFKLARRAGVSASHLELVVAQFNVKRREAAAAMHGAAATASLQEFRRARAAAIAYGCSSDDIEAADSRVGSRRLGIAAALPVATRAVWRELQTLQRLHSQFVTGKGGPHSSGSSGNGGLVKTAAAPVTCGDEQAPVGQGFPSSGPRCAGASAAGLQLCSALADALSCCTHAALGGSVPPGGTAPSGSDICAVVGPAHASPAATTAVSHPAAAAAVARAAAASAADAHAAAVPRSAADGKTPLLTAIPGLVSADLSLSISAMSAQATPSSAAAAGDVRRDLSRLHGIVMAAVASMALPITPQHAAGPSLPQLVAPTAEQASGVLAAVQLLWTVLLACAPVALQANAAAALASLALQCRLENADEDHIPATATVPFDYWGTPSLPDWDQRASASSSSSGSSTGSSGSTDVDAGHSGAGGAGSGGTELRGGCGVDHVALHAVARLQGGRGFRGHHMWPVAQQRRALATHSAGPCCWPTPHPPPLNALTSLDLSLERLSTLAGLDALCPTLTALTANSNQLPTLSGLGRLSSLTHLSLKANCLSTLHSLPTAHLQTLLLDGNQLHTPASLTALPQCSSLHTLSLADNGFDLGPHCSPAPPPSSSHSHRSSGGGGRGGGGGALESGVFQAEGLLAVTTHQGGKASGVSVSLGVERAAGAGELGLVRGESCLAVLLLPGNRLTWLGGGLLRCCGNLVTLDVSRNQLTSLEGLHLVPGLQSLSAACNNISTLPPHHLLLPHLTSLDLSSNTLSTLPAPLLLPSLQSLNLQGNRLTSLQPLHGLPALHTLDLSFNHLPTLDSLQALAPLSALLHLKVHDNPLEKAGLGLEQDPAAIAIQLLPPQRSVRDVLRRPPYQRFLSGLLPWLRSLDGDSLVAAAVAGNVWHAAVVSPLVALAASRALRSAGGLNLTPTTAPSFRCTSRTSTPCDAPARTSSAAPAPTTNSVDPTSAASAAAAAAAAAMVPAGQRQHHPTAGTGPASDHTLPTPATSHTLIEQGPPSTLAPLSTPPAHPPTHTHPQSTAAATRPVASAGQGTADSAGAPSRVESASAVGSQGSGGSLNQPRGSFLTRAEAGWAAAGREQLLTGQAGDEEIAGQGQGRALTVAAAAAAESQTRTSVPSSPGQLQHQQHRHALRGMRTLHRQQLLSLAGDCLPGACVTPVGTVGAAISSTVPGTGNGPALQQQQQQLVGGQLQLRPSYFQRLQRGLGVFATVIQAHWRGVCARRVAAHMRSSAYQSHRAACALHIQRAWRGHRTRSSPGLAQLRAAAAAATAEVARLAGVEGRRLAVAEATRRELAAVKIQALARGCGVRRRLRAALHASRYVDDDDFDYAGLPEEDDSFLQDIEQLLRVERLDAQQTAAPAVCDASDQLSTGSQTPPGSSSGAIFEGKEEPLLGTSPGLTQGHVRQHGPSHAGQSSLAGLGKAQPTHPYSSPTRAPPGLALLNTAPSPDTGLAGHDPAHRRPAAAPEVQTQVQPPQQRLPQPLSPMAQPPRHPWLQSRASAPGAPHTLSLRAPATAWRGPACRSGWCWGGMTVGRMAWGLGGSLRAAKGGGATRLGVGCSLPGAPPLALQPLTGGALNGFGVGCAEPLRVEEGKAYRNQRYSDKLHALMTEWGFTDIATAEAYHKRQQRQRAGSNAQRIEAKNRDPAVRLRNLQEAVGSRPTVLGPETALRQQHNHGPALPLHHSSLSPPGGNNSWVNVMDRVSDGGGGAAARSPPGLPPRGAGGRYVPSPPASTAALAGGGARGTATSFGSGVGGGGGGSSGGSGGGSGASLLCSHGHGAQPPRPLGIPTCSSPQRQSQQFGRGGEHNGITYDIPSSSSPLHHGKQSASDSAPGHRHSSSFGADDDNMSIHSFQSARSMGGGVGAGQPGRGESSGGPWGKYQGALKVGDAYSRTGVIAASSDVQPQQRERRSVGRTLLPAVAQNWVLSGDAGEVNSSNCVGVGGRDVRVSRVSVGEGPVVVANGIGGTEEGAAASAATDMARRSLAAAERLEQRARGLTVKL
ncbi:MAG: hypothetical protein WDW36_010367 [Sanguina aurantia]